MTLRAFLTIPVLVAVLALSACGSSNDSGSAGSTTTGATTTGSTTTATSGAAADLTKKCLDAASGISDAKAKAAAEEGCNALADNPQISEALVKARSKCLEAAAKLPIASLQKTATDACNKISTASP